MSYVKLFADILASTIWAESNTTRLVWITMLAMSDRDGKVLSSCPGLAHFARVTLDDCEKALKILSSPDPHSRTKDFDGCRIKAVPGGWHILNYENHRDRNTLEERREKDRLRQERKRARDVAKKLRDVTPVTPCNATSRVVTPSDADADADADASSPSERTAPAALEPVASAPAPRSKPRKPRAVPDTPHHQTIDRWCSAYLDSQGEPYDVQGKDAAAVKSMLRRHSPDEILKQAEKLLFCEDAFHASHRTLQWLDAKWNEVGQLARANSLRIEGTGSKVVREAARAEASGVRPGILDWVESDEPKKLSGGAR